MSERIKAKCKLINENEFIFPRNRLFRDAKFIVRVELEKLDSNSASDWNGMVNTITASFKNALDQEQTKIDANFKFVKNKIRQINN